MKVLQFSFYIFALLLLIVSSPSTAENLCTSPDSDSDGDGWGWENDASCLADASLARQPPPVCQLTTSDPDGDNWGWENNASCIVDTTSSVVPGDSISAATAVVVDAVLENTLTSGSETHWYSFDIDAGEFAIELSNGDDFFDELSIQLEDESGVVRANLDYFLGDQSAVFCIDPGRYFLSITSFFFYDELTIPYSVSLTSTDLRCAATEFTVMTEGFTDVFTTLDGGYAYVDPDGALISVTHAGQSLWTVNNILDGYVTGIVASDDNTIYAFNDSEIAAVSATGDELWAYRTRAGSYINHVAADSRGVYVATDYRDVIGLDLNGREQWLAPADTNRGVDSIEIGDDGTLYLRTNDSVRVLRP